MDKEYLESRDTIYVTDESGPRKIPNSKNAIKIVKLNNEIELLSEELNEKESLLENLRKVTSLPSLITLITMVVIYFLVLGKMLYDFALLSPHGLLGLIKLVDPLQITLISGLALAAPLTNFIKFAKNKNKIGLLEIQIRDLLAQIEAKEKERTELELEDTITYITTNSRAKTQSLAEFNREIRTNMIDRLKLISKLYKDKKTILELYERGELMSYLTTQSYEEAQARDIIDLVSKSFVIRPKNYNEDND